ncbi:hypothetical protein H4J38_11970 [Colwellia sp. BRX10-3]|uniref:hypothetical protein n=1 Tax=Colwellia sp. BRX10-3 TaxID=2759844 RepID=UPI0015F57696|nr:hypothetical protein [Colwellia sp. BRX10-3]MBA6391491.1 hypothetical protein [Colwellia sp. BRX10-3]
MLPIHGRWKIEVRDQVLMQWFADSWNEEAVVKYITEFKAAAAPLIDDEWAIISVFEQWELGIPEIEHHVTELCEWFKQHGCVKDCHVYSSNILKSMQLEKMIPHTDEGYERCVFHNVNDAITWLNTEGFVLTNAQFLYDIKISKK